MTSYLAKHKHFVQSKHMLITLIGILFLKGRYETLVDIFTWQFQFASIGWYFRISLLQPSALVSFNFHFTIALKGTMSWIGRFEGQKRPSL